jgi:hypothetical protein
MNGPHFVAQQPNPPSNQSEMFRKCVYMDGEHFLTIWAQSELFRRSFVSKTRILGQNEGVKAKFTGHDPWVRNGPS